MLAARLQREAVKRYWGLRDARHPDKNATRIVAREYSVSPRSVYYFRSRHSRRRQ